ncbi:M1 family metallopeptidase [Sphingomonas lacunae]|nr:M1 family metallopeptidase [Sphingomonas lacunae]
MTASPNTPALVQRPVAPILATADAVDTASFARPQIARVTHVALDLDLDFATRRVAGTATLDILAADQARDIILDNRGLEIATITDGAGRPLPWTVGAEVDGLGTPLTVTMGEARRIIIRYRSGQETDALQWLTPEQTAGKRHPYLLSQGQAILNRSWIPTQDSPGIRQTWEARITAPEPLTVVMSGDRLTPQGEPAGPGRRAFRFRMDHPVAPYLIAIAAGDIVFRELGPRTGVWTEPAMIDAAASELADTEQMVEAAEQLYGPYRWGRYDVIVLPPSFPYGGMENPTLTFLTPTFIAGDKSLVGLVAHELAHSWSGNLVTNANWSDSWLNEGVTSYFENRIMEQLYGPRRAAQEAALSYDDMIAAFADYGMESSATRLHLVGPDGSPDGGAGGVIYDKGALFLRTLEQITGRERFDAWLRQWFDNHAFQPATSAMILADLRANLVQGDSELESRLLLDDWIHAPGLPANAARPDPAAFSHIDAAVAAFAAGGPVETTAWAGWTTAERLRFVNRLPRAMDQGRLALLDESLGLSAIGNNEVLFAWLKLALANRYEPAVAPAEAFLERVGRRKFVLPLFETLLGQGDWGQMIARRVYTRTRPGYHPVTSTSVDRAMAATPTD